MLSRPATDTQITHGRRLWLYVLCALVMIYLIVPTLIVIPMSFSDSRYLEFPPRAWSLRWYQEYLGSDDWLASTWVSLKAAVLTALVATPLGTLAAYGLHVSRAALTRPLRTVLTLPMLVPVIFIGIGAFFVYSRLGLNNSILGLVAAHSMLALPFVIIAVSGGLETYDMSQEMVARNLGASRIRAFLTITLPQIRLSVASGALFAFITSLDEVVVALFVSGGSNATITRRMFASLRDEIEPTIAAISTLLTVLTVGLMLAAQLLQRRKGGRR